MTVKQMIKNHFKTPRGQRQLKRGPFRARSGEQVWRNAAMSVALKEAADV